MSTDPATTNPYDPKGLGNVALAALTALAQAKCKTLNLTKLLCDMPEAEHCRAAIKAALDGGHSHDHIRNLMKAAFGGDLAGQSNTTVAQAALFPAMEPEMAQASIIPDHEEGLERSIAKAQGICNTHRSIEKAQVGAYTRTHLGKVIQVHEYSTRRQKSMDATKAAHAASDDALKARGPEHHQKAVAAHLEALRHHTEAHELSPSDVTQDHKELKEHHRAAARWHSDKAKGATAAYGTAKEEAMAPVERPTHKAHHEASTRVVNGKVVQVAAYDDHRAQVAKYSSEARASGKAAFKQTQSLAKDPTSTPHEHNKASEAHAKAVMDHRDALITARKAGDHTAAAHHDEMSFHHHTAHRLHQSKGGKGDAPSERDVALAHAAFKEHYGVAKQEPVRPVAKAHHNASTRNVGGKIVQVSAYDDKRVAALSKKANEASKWQTIQDPIPMTKDAGRASNLAHLHTWGLTSKGVESSHTHEEAAEHHEKAAAAHDVVAKSYKPGNAHEKIAKIHREVAAAHRAKHQADTQTPAEAPKSHNLTIAHLTQHDDEHKGSGRGYLGHEFRSSHTDKALVEAANKHGLSEHELEAYAKSRPGRHDMDGVSFFGGYRDMKDGEDEDAYYEKRANHIGKAAGHEKLVEHFHKAIDRAKNSKQEPGWLQAEAERLKEEKEG